MIFSLLCSNLTVGTAVDLNFIIYGEMTSCGSISDFLSSLTMEAWEDLELRMKCMKWSSSLRKPLVGLGIWSSGAEGWFRDRNAELGSLMRDTVLGLIVAVIVISELSNRGQYRKSDSGGLVAALTVSLAWLCARRRFNFLDYMLE